jgi:DnaK suppressor protein
VPLTDDQRAEIKRALEILVDELDQSLEGTAAAARPVELDQPAVGRVSRIDAIQQQKMLEANRFAQKTRLAQARDALRRCDDDEFGECQGCGEEIGFARLTARPESVFCIVCQSARE